jgi:pimeloyl-ACP methyl ester carboxylesterase
MMSIRTIILGERDFDTDAITVKPTLVLIHGFGGSGVTMYPIFRVLMEHYRLVLLDQIGFGGSTRIQKMPANCFESVEAMDQY